MGVTHTSADGGQTASDVRPAEVASFALADHLIPTGREEAWRFTPLSRLRGLHNGTAVTSPEGKVVVEVDAAPQVRVETVDRTDARLNRSGPPNDRVAAQAWDAYRDTPATVGEFIKTEIAKWNRVIRDAGIKAE